MTDLLSVTSPGLVDVIAGVLVENGPMTEDRLVAALAGRGVDLGDDPGEVLDEVLDDGDGLVAVLADERWASLPALLAGRVFTHRVSWPTTPTPENPQNLALGPPPPPQSSPCHHPDQTPSDPTTPKTPPGPWNRRPPDATAGHHTPPTTQQQDRKRVQVEASDQTITPVNRRG